MSRGNREKTVHSRDYHVLVRLLIQARRAAGLTQTQVAERMDYRTSAISKFERCELRLDFIQVRDYCAAVDLPLEDFVRRFLAAVAANSDALPEG